MAASRRKETVYLYSLRRNSPTRSRPRIAVALRFLAMEPNFNLFPARVPPAEFARRLRRVCRILEGPPKSTQRAFLTTPKGPLSGRTPLEPLAAGEYAAVRTADDGFAHSLVASARRRSGAWMRSTRHTAFASRTGPRSSTQDRRRAEQRKRAHSVRKTLKNAHPPDRPTQV